MGVFPQRSLEGVLVGMLEDRGVFCGSMVWGVGYLDMGGRRGGRGYFSVFRSTLGGTSGAASSLFSAKVGALHKEYCVLAGGVV